MLFIWLFAGHIGSNDAELSTNHLSAIQNQMQSKGGYEMNSLRVQVNSNEYFHLRSMLNLLIFNYSSKHSTIKNCFLIHFRHADADNVEHTLLRSVLDCIIALYTAPLTFSYDLKITPSL